MEGLSWQEIGAAIGTIGLVAGGIWTAMLKGRKDRAETRAVVAEENSRRVRAEAQEDVFKLLTIRLTALEEEVRVLRSELAEERSLSRKLHIHIFKLEDLMRNHNIDPPKFEDLLL